MAVYSINDALSIRGLSVGCKKYLERLSHSGLERVRNKQFEAINKDTLKTIVEKEFEEIEQRKAEKAENKKEFVFKGKAEKITYSDVAELIKFMCKGTRQKKALTDYRNVYDSLSELYNELNKQKRVLPIIKTMKEQGFTDEQIAKVTETLQ